MLRFEPQHHVGPNFDALAGAMGVTSPNGDNNNNNKCGLIDFSHLSTLLSSASGRRALRRTLRRTTQIAELHPTKRSEARKGVN